MKVIKMKFGKVEIDLPNGREAAERALTPEIRKKMHDELIRFCTPYVPMDEEILRDSATATPEYASWNTPYAHAQYVGGQFVPSKENPTEMNVEFKNYKETGTGKEWDRVMLQNKRREFIAALQDVVDKGGG